MPLNKRIWLWISDHPGKTPADISHALRAPHSNVSATLNDLMARGMLSRTETKRHTSHGVRKTHEYTVAMREYELLPVRKKATPAAKPPLAPAETNAAPAPKQVIQPIGITVESMPLADAFAMWKKLGAYFGAPEGSQ